MDYGIEIEHRLFNKGYSYGRYTLFYCISVTLSDDIEPFITIIRQCELSDHQLAIT